MEQSPAADSVEFATATGDIFGSKGQFTVEAESMEGYKRKYTFQNADVTVPILSIGKLTDDEHDVMFKKHGGKIIHVPTGEEIHFIRRHGVYFIQYKFE